MHFVSKKLKCLRAKGFFFSIKVSRQRLCFQPSGKLDFLSIKTKWRYTSSFSQWDPITGSRSLFLGLEDVTGLVMSKTAFLFDI